MSFFKEMNAAPPPLISQVWLNNIMQIIDEFDTESLI